MYQLQRWCQLPLGTKYWFDSFGDSSTTQFLASGTVATTGQKEGDYIELVVTSNSSTSMNFVGNKYWVSADAKDDGSVAYQLYTGAGTGGTGMYVKVYSEAPKRTVNVTVDDGTDPIQSASVVIDETTKTTGSAGGCSFSLVDGTYEIEISKDGYTTKTEEVTVDYENNSFTISLTSA